jgi:hypothetical protein
MLHTRSRRLLAAFIIALTLTALFILLGGGQGSVAGGGLPPRPDDPTATPTAPPPTAVPATPTHGAAIHLHTSEPMPGTWTVVQWQNEHGNWYDAVGWRGHLDEGQADRKTWWVYPPPTTGRGGGNTIMSTPIRVSPAHYGQGPFRWLVYASEDGKQVAISDPFDLPTRNGQTISVTVELP